MKQIFELESIPSVFLYDILKKLSAKLCLDVSGFGFCLDLLHFVSLLTTYAVAYCHTHLWITDQSWQTGPNEFVLHFEAVFVVC